MAIATEADRRRRRGILGAVLCITVFGFGQSISFPLLTLTMESRGITPAMIGVNTAMQALAMLIAGPFLARAVARAGLPLFLGVGTVAAVLCVLAFAVTADFILWTAIRMVYGVAAGMLYFGSELWIVSLADPRRRGRTIALYAISLSVGFALGPVVLSRIGVSGMLPFIVTAIACGLAAVPAWMARGAAPDDLGEGHGGPALGFFRSDPTILFAIVLFGAIESGVLGLIPVWGVATGLTPERAALLLAVVGFGNVAFQWPLGAVADRVDRRLALTGCALVCVVSAVLLPFVAGTGWPLWTVLFCLGGISVGLYTVALSELGARYRGAALAEANGAIVLGYGMGMLLGPPLAGAAMEAWRPHGLALALGVFALAYLALAVRRMAQSA